MPYAAYAAIIAGCTVCLFAGFNVFKPFDVEGFVTSYFGIAFAAVMYSGFKIAKKTKFVKPEEADLFSGKQEVDEECRIWEEPGAAKHEGWHKWWDALW